MSATTDERRTAVVEALVAYLDGRADDVIEAVKDLPREAQVAAIHDEAQSLPQLAVGLVLEASIIGLRREVERAQEEGILPVDTEGVPADQWVDPNVSIG